jgi:hypothetical protein
MSKVLLRAMLVSLLAVSLPVAAQEEPQFQTDFGREDCTFTSVGQTPYFPLIPGVVLTLEGEEEDDGETVEIRVVISVLGDTEVVDGVTTRVYEEREFEDDELVEVSRNFMAVCRETGDVWYFGEDVDDYEDGVIVGHGGAWRAGVNGAKPGIIMPGSPVLGARFHQELAPGVAEDRAEITGVGEELTVPAGTYENVLATLDSSALDEGSGDEKFYARGIGIIKDADAELVEIELPDCVPGDATLCLNDGRFEVEVEWTSDGATMNEASVTPVANDSGEVWFFRPGNVEMVVKVLDACGVEGFNNYWVFASGLTDRGVVLTVKDTKSGTEKEYSSDLHARFPTILDTAAFQTCP